MQFIEGHFVLPLAPLGVLLAMPLIVVTVTLVNKLYVEAL